MNKLTRTDYLTFERFTKEVLTRLSAGDHSIEQAHEILMDPVKAWDKDDLRGVIPYMRNKLKEWRNISFPDGY